MRHTTYATPRERKRDQIRGVVTAALVNVGLLLCAGSGWARVGAGGLANADTLLLIVSITPWVVNGILVGLLFLLRPAMGVGYVAAFGLVILAALILGAVSFASCLAGMVAGFALGALSPDMAGGALLLVWAGGSLWGVFLLLRLASASFSSWWSDEQGEGASGPTPTPRDEG